MAELTYWDIGEDVPLTASFADDDGNLFDPDTVTFVFQNPKTFAKTTFTWTSVTPGTDIVRLGIGRFRVRMRPITDGFWHWTWTGDGTPKRIIQSTEDTAVPVRPNVF